MNEESVTINYKTADGRRICVDVSPRLADLLEQTDRHIRSQGRQDRRRLIFVPDMDGLTDTTMRTPRQTDAAEIAAVNERNRRLYAALDTLSEVQRQRVDMLFFDGLKYAQIAELEGIDYKTVWTTVQRVLKKLRAILDAR